MYLTAAKEFFIIHYMYLAPSTCLVSWGAVQKTAREKFSEECGTRSPSLPFTLVIFQVAPLLTEYTKRLHAKDFKSKYICIQNNKDKETVL